MSTKPQGSFSATHFFTLILSALFFAGSAAMNHAHAYATPRLKPPPPPLVFISKGDLAKVHAVTDALDRRAFSLAKSTASTVEAPIAQSLAKWYYFYAEDPLLNVQDADAFLDTHVDWPALSKIQRHAESRITNTTRPRTILDFFDNRDPLTGDGKRHLARALLSNGDREAAILHIRDAWVNDRFTAQEEKRLLSQYRSFLTKEDHAARVDRLLFARQVTNARRVFAYLSPADRRRAETRASLLLQANSAAASFDRLSNDDRLDPGVLHAAVRYFRRKKEEPRALILSRQAPDDPTKLRNPARWWDERQLLMRWALKNKLYAEAYAAAANHGLEPGSGDFAEAEFNAGWIALRFLDDATRAEKHFAALAGNVDTPISLSRGLYWLGRAAEAAGDKEKANRRFADASKYVYSYYGQLAAEKIGGAPLNLAFQPSPPASPAEKAKFASRPTAQALRILTEVGDARTFLIFGYHLDGQLDSPGEYLEFADVAKRLAATHVTVRAGKAGIRRGSFAPEVAYPTIYIPEEASRFAPPELILGLSRQESEFNARAYSRAGARGLMQLIPSTAQLTARKERLPYRRSALLNDPNYNMTIGAAHVSHLLTKYNGNYAMVFSAYNAGPHRVTRWVEEFGDPRSDAVDPIDWVEQIPFSETRNYVQRVLENMQVYRSRLGGAPIAGKLAGDLERGGGAGRVGGRPAIKSAGFVPEISPRLTAIANTVLETLDAQAQTAEAASGSTAPTSLPGQAPSPDEPVNAPKEQAANEAPSTIAPAPTPVVAKSQDAHEDRSITDIAVASDEPGAAGAIEPSLEAHSIIAPAIAPSPPAFDNASADLPVAPASNAERPAAASSTAAATPTPPGSPDECQGYADYLAAVDPDAATAADLNAGSLAELESGGPRC